MNRYLSVGAIVAVVLLGSCAYSTLPLSDRDRCGLQSMELKGVSLSSGRSRSVHGRGGDSTSSGRALSCEPPPDVDSRICQVNAYHSRAAFKRAHGAMTVGGRDELLKQADAVWKSTYRKCLIGAGDDPDAEAVTTDQADDEQE
jgi:hypothetical protein